eukprot:403368943
MQTQTSTMRSDQKVKILTIVGFLLLSFTFLAQNKEIASDQIDCAISDGCVGDDQQILIMNDGLNGGKSSLPLISVVGTSYNRGALLEESIIAIINQTFTNWELILVDDSSSNQQTLQILEKYESLGDSRIKIIRQPVNYGFHAYGRNLGLHFAKGQYLTFFDDDDLNHYQRLEKQVNFLISHPYVDMVSSRIRCVDGNGDRLWDQAQLGTHHEEFLFRNIFNFSNTIPASLFRLNDTVRELMNFEFVVAEDYHLLTRLIYENNYTVASLPDIHYIYRDHHHLGKRASAITSKQGYYYNLHLMRQPYLYQTYPIIYEDKRDYDWKDMHCLMFMYLKYCTLADPVLLFKRTNAFVNHYKNLQYLDYDISHEDDTYQEQYLQKGHKGMTKLFRDARWNLVKFMIIDNFPLFIKAMTDVIIDYFDLN